MVLSGLGIIEAVKKGKIFIEGFDEKKVNPNSYNLTLGNKLLIYKKFPLDMKIDNETEELDIPEEGLVLQPGMLYLGFTNEKTCTNGFVPIVEGRSSIARLGVKVHLTAGFGDNGFNGRWTLEIEVTHPIKVYPNVELCQIWYQPIAGDDSMKYDGKYQGSTDIVASKLFKDFE